MFRLSKWIVGSAGALTTAIVVALALPAMASAGNYCMITGASRLSGHAGDRLKLFANVKGADFVTVGFGDNWREAGFNRTRVWTDVPDLEPGKYDLNLYCSDVDGGSTYSRQFTILPSN